MQAAAFAKGEYFLFGFAYPLMEETVIRWMRNTPPAAANILACYLERSANHEQTPGIIGREPRPFAFV